jgi:hypothetical protein
VTQLCDTEFYEYQAKRKKLIEQIQADPQCRALLIDGWTAEELADSILQKRLPDKDG